MKPRSRIMGLLLVPCLVADPVVIPQISLEPVSLRMSGPAASFPSQALALTLAASLFVAAANPHRQEGFIKTVQTRPAVIRTWGSKRKRRPTFSPPDFAATDETASVSLQDIKLFNWLVGQRIRQRRQSLKWNQSRLSRISGVPQSRISDIEAGRRGLVLSHVLALAHTLHLSPVALFRPASGEDDTSPPFQHVTFGQIGKRVEQMWLSDKALYDGAWSERTGLQNSLFYNFVRRLKLKKEINLRTLYVHLIRGFPENWQLAFQGFPESHSIPTRMHRVFFTPGEDVWRQAIGEAGASEKNQHRKRAFERLKELHPTPAQIVEAYWQHPGVRLVDIAIPLGLTVERVRQYIRQVYVFLMLSTSETLEVVAKRPIREFELFGLGNKDSRETLKTLDDLLAAQQSGPLTLWYERPFTAARIETALAKIQNALAAYLPAAPDDPKDSLLPSLLLPLMLAGAGVTAAMLLMHGLSRLPVFSGESTAAASMATTLFGGAFLPPLQVSRFLPRSA